MEYLGISLTKYTQAIYEETSEGRNLKITK